MKGFCDISLTDFVKGLYMYSLHINRHIFHVSNILVRRFYLLLNAIFFTHEFSPHCEIFVEHEMLISQDN